MNKFHNLLIQMKFFLGFIPFDLLLTYLGWEYTANK